MKRPFASSDVISTSLVGSNINSKFNNKSDIDLVVITKNLNKKIFNDCIKSIKFINLGDYKLQKYKIFINSTFGPLKFKNKNQITIHLMIYDIKGHIKHVLDSPFTCLDWERSKKYMGICLKDIFSVGNLTLNDFFNNRRSIKSYISDLKDEVITYRKYNFDDNDYDLLLKKKKIYSKFYKSEYSYHIFKNLVSNYYKFIFQKNIKINDQIFKKVFLDITDGNIQLYKIYLNLKNIKYNRDKNTNSKINFLDETLEFTNYFYKKIDYIKKNSNKITFIRHAKTKFKKNIFIGQKINPAIELKHNKKKYNKINYDYCYSSELRRAIQSAHLFFKNQLIFKNKLLNEINYGLVEGLTFADVKKQFPNILEKWNQNIDIHFPDGENNQDLLNRLNKFNDVLVDRFSNKNNIKVLVVTHNVFLRSMIGNFFNVPIHKWFKIQINYLENIESIMVNNKIILNIPRDKILKTILL